ncbi:hypothetical protein ACLKA6_000166 [Drosophila palustris]
MSHRSNDRAVKRPPTRLPFYPLKQARRVPWLTTSLPDMSWPQRRGVHVAEGVEAGCIYVRPLTPTIVIDDDEDEEEETE